MRAERVWRVYMWMLEYIKCLRDSTIVAEIAAGMVECKVRKQESGNSMVD